MYLGGRVHPIWDVIHGSSDTVPAMESHTGLTEAGITKRDRSCDLLTNNSLGGNASKCAFGRSSLQRLEPGRGYANDLPPSPT